MSLLDALITRIQEALDTPFGPACDLEADNVQDAICEVKGSALGNDLDKFQFARQGNTSNNTYMLTLNNIVGYDSPDTLKYDMIFRGFSLSVSNVCASFTLELWTASPDHSIRTMIYTETFSIGNGNFNGHSGYTQADLSIPLSQGDGIYLRVASVGNPKPSDLSIFAWTRQV